MALTPDPVSEAGRRNPVMGFPAGEESENSEFFGKQKNKTRNAFGRPRQPEAAQEADGAQEKPLPNFEGEKKVGAENLGVTLAVNPREPEQNRAENLSAEKESRNPLSEKTQISDSTSEKPELTDTAGLRVAVEGRVIAYSDSLKGQYGYEGLEDAKIQDIVDQVTGMLEVTNRGLPPSAPPVTPLVVSDMSLPAVPSLVGNAMDQETPQQKQQVELLKEAAETSEGGKVAVSKIARNISYSILVAHLGQDVSLAEVFADEHERMLVETGVIDAPGRSGMMSPGDGDGDEYGPDQNGENVSRSFEEQMESFEKYSQPYERSERADQGVWDGATNVWRDAATNTNDPTKAQIRPEIEQTVAPEGFVKQQAEEARKADAARMELGTKQAADIAAQVEAGGPSVVPAGGVPETTTDQVRAALSLPPSLAGNNAALQAMKKAEGEVVAAGIAAQVAAGGPSNAPKNGVPNTPLNDVRAVLGLSSASPQEMAVATRAREEREAGLQQAKRIAAHVASNEESVMPEGGLKKTSIAELHRVLGIEGEPAPKNAIVMSKTPQASTATSTVNERGVPVTIDEAKQQSLPAASPDHKPLSTLDMLRAGGSGQSSVRPAAPHTSEPEKHEAKKDAAEDSHEEKSSFKETLRADRHNSSQRFNALRSRQKDSHGEPNEKEGDSSKPVASNEHSPSKSENKPVHEPTRAAAHTENKPAHAAEAEHDKPSKPEKVAARAPAAAAPAPA